MLLKISLVAYIFHACIQDGMIFSFYGKLIDRLPHWLSKPLGGCHRCFAGQVFFWYYLVSFENYNIIDHAFYASFGIIMAMVWHLVYLFIDSQTLKLE